MKQARYLAEQVQAAENLELTAPVPSNVVNLRYVPAAWNADDDRLDALNRTVLETLHARGVAVPSHTRIDGRFTIRVAITNHRSQQEDFDALIDAVTEIGASASR